MTPIDISTVTDADVGRRVIYHGPSKAHGTCWGLSPWAARCMLVLFDGHEHALNVFSNLEWAPLAKRRSAGYE